MALFILKIIIVIKLKINFVFNLYYSFAWNHESKLADMIDIVRFKNSERNR